MKKLFVIFFLLIPFNIYASPPSRQNTYVSGDLIEAADVTANEDALFNYLTGGVDTYADNTIVNADINNSAAIQSDKLTLTSIAQNVAITSGGSFTNGGTTDLNGNTTIGDEAGDTFTIDSDTWTFTNGVTISGTWTNLGTVTTADINGGTLDGVQIGGTTATGELIVNDSSDGANGLGDQGTALEVLQSAGAGANPIWATDLNFSNVVFQYVALLDNSGSGKGEILTTSLNPGSVSGNFRYLQTANTSSYETLVSTKWKKISGVSTWTVYAQLWVNAGLAGDQISSIQMSVGGQTGLVSTADGVTSPGWETFTVDVSSLNDGTVYDVLLQLKHIFTTNASIAFCGNVIAFGS